MVFLLPGGGERVRPRLLLGRVEGSLQGAHLGCDPTGCGDRDRGGNWEGGLGRDGDEGGDGDGDGDEGGDGGGDGDDLGIALSITGDDH